MKYVLFGLFLPEPLSVLTSQCVMINNALSSPLLQYYSFINDMKDTFQKVNEGSIEMEINPITTSFLFRNNDD